MDLARGHAAKKGKPGFKTRPAGRQSQSPDFPCLSWEHGRIIASDAWKGYETAWWKIRLLGPVHGRPALLTSVSGAAPWGGAWWEGSW